MTVPVFRFAPSPNGELHLGHAFSALSNAGFAQRMGGRLLLRIEDIDVERCTPQFEAGIFRDLAWLGLSWEEPVRRQSRHFDDYSAALRTLVEAELVYPATMSRGAVRAHIAQAQAQGRPWPRDPDGAPLYPGLEKALPPRKRRAIVAQGTPFAWRLDMARAVAALGGPAGWSECLGERLERETAVAGDPMQWGDVIVARSEVPSSYHLSVVVDDALQGVTHVVRGADLFAATAVHRVLQRHLRLPEPVYHHHRLILDADGRKLSKSRRDTALAELRAAGRTPAELRAMVGL